MAVVVLAVEAVATITTGTGEGGVVGAGAAGGRVTIGGKAGFVVASAVPAGGDAAGDSEGGEGSAGLGVTIGDGANDACALTVGDPGTRARAIGVEAAVGIATVGRVGGVAAVVGPVGRLNPLPPQPASRKRKRNHNRRTSFSPYAPIIRHQNGGLCP